MAVKPVACCSMFQRVQQVQVNSWMVVISVFITDDFYWKLSSNKKFSA